METQELFAFFDVDQGGTLSLKEFIIGLTNFTSASMDEKMRFAFKLYDEVGTKKFGCWLSVFIFVRCGPEVKN